MSARARTNPMKEESVTEEFVHVMGPEEGGVPGRVTRKAFDEIWSGRGYRIVDDDQATSPATQAELDAGAPTTTSSKKKGA